MLAFSLALRQLRSHWQAGEVRVLLLALVLAITATTSVGFFTDRIQGSINSQGGQLLGADLVINADHPLPEQYLKEAQKRKLQTTSSLEFPSMVIHADASQLAEIKAVGEGFPLRGDLTVSQQAIGGGVSAKAQAASIPSSGSVWIAPRLAQILDLKIGDTVDLGNRKLQVTAFLQNEPSRGGNMFNIAPRLLMNQADVASTGLIQFGSRARYQLLLASDRAEIADYAAWAKPQLQKGERIEDLRSARPEIRSARDKAEQFLGLAAMVGVMLAMVAMFLASLPYIQTSLDTYALMRCFGATKKLIMQILLWQTILLALTGSLVGCLLGYAAQAGLASLAGRLFVETLPPPSLMPVLAGLVTGFAAMLAVVWPHLRRLQHVPALRILRRDLGDFDVASWLSFIPAILVLAALIFWNAGDLKLGAATLLGLLGLVFVTGLLAWLASKALQRLPEANSSTWKLGLAAMKRRPGMTVAQVLGFSLGLMALILLALVRGDLLQSWQASLPADAPNRFMINIQPAQISDIKQFLSDSGIQGIEMSPMVRARLLAINHKPLDTSQYKDEAKRLAEREFNLSWAENMQQDNKIVAGQWWTKSDAGKPMLSLEKGIAESLKLKLGDVLTYNIGGSELDLTVSSLRKVEWDTMRTNFFAVTPPGLLENFSASYITSLHLEKGQEETLNRLVKRFPNITIIDIAALLDQVQQIITKMTHAIEYVFAFSLLAGVAVLYAALIATRAERIREATLLRVLGASRKQVTAAVLAEFLSIGLISAVVATLTASGLAWYISTQTLGIPYTFNWHTSLLALIGSILLVPLAAWLAVRGFLNQPPRNLLNSI
ncbi:MAG: ABC transporter permease [Methylophilaceae bacterium]|nr:FtsX-like permease family protein [Methyloradius sp.]